MPVCVETSSGTVVERLLDAGLRVYPINPKAAQRFRERHAPSGAKDDYRDAWTMADALRVDGQGWRELKPTDPLIAELRMVCRDEVILIEQRTALVAQLRQALLEYYGIALEAFDDWTAPSSWAFIEAFPTPQLLQSAGRRKWERFLRENHLNRSQERTQQRLEAFGRAHSFSGSKAAVAAKSLLAVTLVRLLQTLEAQLEVYRERIRQLFAQHPDHDLFGSLPGAGEKLAPRLLSEIGDDRSRFESAENLQCLAGSVPITKQSGKAKYQLARLACHKGLRATLHLWADLSRHSCAWAATYYKAHRDRGQSHATALRCLANRWVKILFRMWQDRTPYNEALHTRNQLTHGSWLLTLTTQQNP
jgi:transposase